ncbi:HD domain-containing protein [Streptomyces sp. NPDC047081]|uniref:HD domain-containing protein n=1 Tax=Streptomyces sp. NPDC047081 TaxID=3154706 RepID=UPI0033C137CE
MTTPDPLHRALHDPCAPPLRPLPTQVARLLRDLEAPPRLAAHLRLVHDVAQQLLDWMTHEHPSLQLDHDAVLFGAATHDIGKTAHPAELSGPGSAHEPAGRDLLLARGIAPELARFAATHAEWTHPDNGLEDLLVSVADKIWKGKRVQELEDLVVARLATATGRTAWEEFLTFDDLLTTIADDAEKRLAFQATYPVDRGVYK